MNTGPDVDRIRNLVVVTKNHFPTSSSFSSFGARPSTCTDASLLLSKMPSVYVLVQLLLINNYKCWMAPMGLLFRLPPLFVTIYLHFY
ncbi:unnamed protein product [Amoebophrya sp. A25]|nr:unnamed protein product [Amoebophrya sp. A25]|eukprot:GSA25T00011101001.1